MIPYFKEIGMKTILLIKWPWPIWLKDPRMFYTSCSGMSNTADTVKSAGLLRHLYTKIWKWFSRQISFHHVYNYKINNYYSKRGENSFLLEKIEANHFWKLVPHSHKHSHTAYLRQQIPSHFNPSRGPLKYLPDSFVEVLWHSAEGSIYLPPL